MKCGKGDYGEAAPTSKREYSAKPARAIDGNTLILRGVTVGLQGIAARSDGTADDCDVSISSKIPQTVADPLVRNEPVLARLMSLVNRFPIIARQPVYRFV